MKTGSVKHIAPPLVTWYKAHERAFPWRTDLSPYRVWVSEIMLQQTRIEAALPYFERFMEALPTVTQLADAKEDLLLKLWEGLGYYSRVRNLQKAARQIVENHSGVVPDSYEELLKLSGIGEYTAGAIASIAFGKRVAAVDGNVLRVMARLTDESGDVMQPAIRKKLSALVNEIVPEESPGDFNQGLMELGETLCIPNGMPHCEQCPIREYCAVAGTERAATLPTRAAAKPRRVEERVVLTVLTDEIPARVLLHRREKSGLLSGMWELPNYQKNTEADPLTTWNMDLLSEREAPKGKHVFSHVEWRLSGKIVTVKPVKLSDEYCWVTKEQLKNYALPTAFRLYAAALDRLL